MNTDTTVPLLDLAIAAEMRSHEDLARRLKLARISRQRLKTARRIARDAGAFAAVRPTSDMIIGAFGPPHWRNDHRLCYPLVLWPEHTFQFGVHEGDWVSHDGFCLAAPAVEGCSQQSLSSPYTLKAGYHTADLVRVLFGEPALIEGWERMEDWYYAEPEPRPPVVLEFDFNLLINITRRYPIGLPFRSV